HTPPRALSPPGSSTRTFNRPHCCPFPSCSSVVVIPLPPPSAALHEGNAPLGRWSCPPGRTYRSPPPATGGSTATLNSLNGPGRTRRRRPPSLPLPPPLRSRPQCPAVG